MVRMNTRRIGLIVGCHDHPAAGQRLGDRRNQFERFGRRRRHALLLDTERPCSHSTTGRGPAGGLAGSRTVATAVVSAPSGIVVV